MRREDYNLQETCKSSQQQLTQRLSQPASHNTDALGFTMTVGGEAVLINGSIIIIIIIIIIRNISISNNSSLTLNSALFYAVVIQKIKHCLCSKKRSGGFIQVFIVFYRLSCVRCRSGLLLFSYRKSNSLRSNEWKYFNQKKNFKIKDNRSSM